MNYRFLRQLRTGLRMLLPTGSDRRYAQAIRRSGLLNRSYYVTSNPRMPLLARLMPERHYVVRGEALGICPSADFSPLAYLHLNPDLAAKGIRPLEHYIANGLAEHRAARDLPTGQADAGLPLIGPLIGPQDAPEPAAPFAVVVHLFYREMWPELAAVLAAQQFRSDLYVTLTEGRGDDAEMARHIRRDFPLARVWTLPNQGRDILPFVHLANSGVLRGYRAICKLHTKKSPHRTDGDQWRRRLIGGILGDAGLTAARLGVFAADPLAGFWVADGHVSEGGTGWGANEARSRTLLARARIAPDRAALRFAAGSIYWISSAAVDLLAGLHLSAGDFEREIGQVDGTTAHALERVLGVLAGHAGLTVCCARALDAAAARASAGARSA